MKKIITILLAVFLLVPGLIFAQYEGGHTFSANGNDLEIGGFMVVFYQFRPKYTGDTKSSKNNVVTLDDARVSFRGDVKGQLFFHFETNLAALGSWLGADPTTNTVTPFSSPKDMPITECHVTYKIPVTQIQLKVGYMKVPFGLLNLEDKQNSFFQERWKFGNGDYDPRRDAGLQLYRDFWHERINITGGVFSGMGENIIYGIQDHQGRLMYAGRIELMNQHMNWNEYEKSNKDIPAARIAANVKYNDKTEFSGDGTDVFSTENVRTIDGQKLSYGGDVDVCWHGFSLIGEWQQHQLKPHNDAGNGLLALLNEDAAGLTDVEHKTVTVKYLEQGGYYIEANYFNRKWLSGVAVRYDQYNLSENIFLAGYANNAAQDRSITFAYVFQFPRLPLQFKVHYAHRLLLPGGAHWAEDELRVGFLYMF